MTPRDILRNSNKVYAQLKNGKLKMRKSLAILLCVVCTILASGTIENAEAIEQNQPPAFNLDYQFQVFTIDLKTETVYSSNFYLRMWTYDPLVKSFEAVVLRPDYDEAIRFESGNVSGNEQIYEQIQTDPLKVTTPWQWRLTAKRFLLGSPFDYYQLSFLIAVNSSTKLEMNNTWVILPFSMRGDWTWDEHPNVEKLAAPPDNQTLIDLGLNPAKFHQYGCQDMPDFYLITTSFSFPLMYSVRIAAAYLLPSITILFVLALATTKFKRLSITDSLTLYLGVGLFILSFLVSFYQYAPSKVLTWQEAIFFFDFLFVTGLVSAAFLKRKKSMKENKTKTESGPPPQKDVEMSGKEQMQVQRLISELASRENSTLVVSTITASVSVAILVVAMPSINAPWFGSASLVGIVFSVMGFLYREVTILLVDSRDFEILRSYAPRFSSSEKSRKVATFFRMFIIRFLLLMPIPAWVEVKTPQESLSATWALSIAMLCGVAFALSLLEHFMREDP